MNKEYFIYMNLDGFGRYYYDIANESMNGTPNLNNLIEQGVFFDNLYTGIPSITFPMQSSILSGAYSEVTDNCCQYYDKKHGRLVKCNHSNKGETLGEVLNSLNKPFISIQQFVLNERGCNFDNDKFVYFQPGGNYKVRFQLLKDIINGKKVSSKDKEYIFKDIPEYIFFYADDLDALGHNPPYTSYAPLRVKAITEGARVNSVIGRLKEIDEEIGKVINLLKEKNIYEDTTILITSDHGMIPYKGKSSIPKLIKALENIGFENIKVVQDNNKKIWNRDKHKLIEIKENNKYKEKSLTMNEHTSLDMYNFENKYNSQDTAIKETEVIIASTGIQCQLYFMGNINLKEIKNKLSKEEYIEKCLTKEELKERGVSEKFADILISPKPFMHFNLDLNTNFILNASHDSLNEKCQKVFGVIKGSKIKHGVIYREKSYNIDLIPTACTVLNIPLMRGSKGKVINDIML